MLPNKILKYILDIDSVIQEIESIKSTCNNNFENFNSNFILSRAIERQLEIIGEALNKLKQLEPDIAINSVKSIIALRNLIAHAYDSVDNEILWGIIQKDIPNLKKDIDKLRSYF